MPSSVVDSYTYDADKADLTIRYVSGIVYCYKEVPERIYKEFRASGAKGRYLNFHIKGKFSYEKLMAQKEDRWAAISGVSRGLLNYFF